MIEVYKTSIEDQPTADDVTLRLIRLFPESRINFDIQDCDHVLKIESPRDIFNSIPTNLQQWGYSCEVLDY